MQREIREKRYGLCNGTWIWLWFWNVPDHVFHSFRFGSLTRYIKRGGQVWIKIFPDKPITEKPAETRMGSGKGSPEYWVAVVKPGRVMFEIAGVSEEVAREAMRLAMHKLPIKCKFIKKEEAAE